MSASRLLLALLLCIPVAAHQHDPGSRHAGLDALSSSDRIAISTDSTGPMRFVAVHGRRAVIMGYPLHGLEVWGYPFQILSDYQVGFKPAGATAEADGQLLLRRIDYRPESVTRVYIGPDYLVREKLFVPLDQAAAVISYEVEGRRQVEIEIHFLPVLNLMWPGASGGQYIRWTPEVSGFVIAEPERGFSAVVGSPEIVAHDDTVNSTVRTDSRFSFSVRPRAAGSATAKATVFVALNAPGAKQNAAALQDLSAHLPEMETEAAAHYAKLEEHALRIRTPDEDVNRALAWSEVALDQAWVCNPMLGCGIVAGYGPSRDQRRPQYAWFFAGDGLVATNALISAGEYSRAKEELEFIAKYQQPGTGMIWHELSQSAGLIDWAKYPYMYVHVDITFDYLSTMARYVAASGDTAFAANHWPSISAAYRYCRSVVRDDHLPHIPVDKEAGDEQHRPDDDLGLSAGSLAADIGFAQLARVTGHTQLADDAEKNHQLTRRAIAAHYWSAGENFWFDSHMRSGEPVFRHAVGPTELIVQNIFSAEQNDALLKQLASADFQTDWGMREVAASAKDYDPYSYGGGSISAPGTTGAATTFWQAHRPESAFALWSGVLQWNTLDSPGHIHEVLAGNFYHEETESVPEQTWSSAGLLDATVRGLLGLGIDGAGNRIHLSPHVPAEWKRISVENIYLPHATLALTIEHSITGLDLEIKNEGTATTIVFEPQIPLGARVLGADFQGRAIPADTKVFAGDEHARLEIDVPPGASHCHLSYTGGVSIIPKQRVLHPGDASAALKITSVNLSARRLSIEADVYSAGDTTFRMQTPWQVTAHSGATLRNLPDDQYEITVERGSEAATSHDYSHARMDFKFDQK